MDADRVFKGLFQGSRPPKGDILRLKGFSLLILCAEEHQPDAAEFPGVTVIHAPNDDDFERLPTREELSRALQAAHQAVSVLEQGGKVLSTCWAGLNRSGLVSALTLHLWLGVDGKTAIKMIRRSRSYRALCNPGFQQVLGNLRARDD